MVEIRRLAVDALGSAAAIDVTEDGSLVFEQAGTSIRSRPETWSRPPRTAAAWRAFEERWRGFVTVSGVALGAFDGDDLVGIATLRRAVRPGIDELDALFVDRAHRRTGVATALVSEIERLARAGGARTLYVSATPSESAVGFYLMLGFGPTAEPIPELLEREPDDVHMTLPL